MNILDGAHGSVFYTFNDMPAVESGGGAAGFPPPSCFAGFLVLPAAVLESLAGVSLLAPGAMTAFMLLFSVAASSFAKVKSNV